jgi:hypothetical protein
VVTVTTQAVIVDSKILFASLGYLTSQAKVGMLSTQPRHLPSNTALLRDHLKDQYSVVKTDKIMV